MTPSLRITIDCGERGQIDPRKIAVLRAIRAHHSIAGAARALGTSYRHTWLCLDEIARILGRPVIETVIGGAAGGGAKLTPAGENIIAVYERMLAGAETSNGSELTALRAMLDVAEPAR